MTSTGAPAPRPLATLLDLAPERVLVTGGARGFGFAICRRLLEAGAAVVLLDREEKRIAAGLERLSETRTEQLTAVVGDVTDQPGVEVVLEDLEHAGPPITALVNNAGVYSNYRFGELPLAEFRRIHDINVVGTFIMTQALVHRWQGRAAAGHVVNIGSQDCVASSAEGLSHYTASKHAVAGLTRSLAMELGPVGIRVNAVCPGAAVTEGVLDLLADGAEHGIDVDAQWAGIVARTPLGRLIDPDEIGLAVVTLLSGLLPSVHGHLLHVEGGILAQPLEGYVDGPSTDTTTTQRASS